jgi:hypothetical protein
MSTEDIKAQIDKIRQFTKKCCVSTVMWNVPQNEINDFKKWYKFLGFKSVYIIDNCSDKKIKDSTIRLEEKIGPCGAMKKIQSWVKLNASEEFVFHCDPDEFLFIDDPDIFDNYNGEFPMGFFWRNYIGSEDKNLIHEVNHVFAYSKFLKINNIKTLGRIDQIENTGRSHYIFKDDFKIVNTDHQEIEVVKHKKEKTMPQGKLLKYFVACSVPAGKARWNRACILHLKIKSREDWMRKAAPDYAWRYYRTGNLINTIHEPTIEDFNHFYKTKKHHQMSAPYTKHLKWIELMRMGY